MSKTLSKNTESYNNSGVFLQAYVVKQFSDYNWNIDIEYPVVVSPFRTDPTRLHGKMRLPNNHFGVMSTRFVNSIQESQNLFEQSERSVDVIAAKSLDDHRILKICVECKKLNPKYTEWCFFKQNSTLVPHIITKNQKNDGKATLFHIPLTEKYGNEIFVQITKQYNDLELLSKEIADYGISLTNEELWNKFFKTETTIVDEACRQVIEGTYGLINDVVKSQIINGDATDYSTTDVFLPIIVTNTKLKLCEYDPSTIDSSTGKLTQEPTYQDIDSILVEYNSPKSVQFPEPLFAPVDAETRRATSKWYVAVMSPKGLEDFLKKCNHLWG